jgi:hypothetical protein
MYGSHQQSHQNPSLMDVFVKLLKHFACMVGVCENSEQLHELITTKIPRYVSQVKQGVSGYLTNLQAMGVLLDLYLESWS